MSCSLTREELSAHITALEARLARTTRASVREYLAGNLARAKDIYRLEYACGCPDDCGCRQPHRTNYCGCGRH